MAGIGERHRFDVIAGWHFAAFHSNRREHSMMMKVLLSTAACIGLAFANPSAHAQGNPQTGKKLVYTCAGCHGIEGYKNAYPNYHVPKLGGQSEKYLVAALTEYRKGERKHPTMQAQASSFSEQDIADIAAYLSTLGTHQ
jgi:cytochrome c553